MLAELTLSLMQTNVRFYRAKLNLLNGLAALSGKSVAEYLGDLVERDAKERGVPIPKPTQPAEAA
ncbi:MAG: hypothetical protein F6K00_19740 [Leptolyngbya sp. SIOISBB]|nr:hypothetical protein [Leptolyngbya sp. SIOISBB]